MPQKKTEAIEKAVRHIREKFYSSSIKKVLRIHARMSIKTT